MLDLLGFLISPRVFLGSLIGLLVGLGAAYLFRLFVVPQALKELLALVVALGILVGILVGARFESRK